jgi:tRNA modification GTPase
MQYTSDNDTICAISTPSGVGGIAVIRISGPRAIEIANNGWRGRSLLDAASHTVHLGTILDIDGTPLDQGVATVYRNPGSFTGEDVVELSIHGSRWIQRQLITCLIARGCRLAEPGEFTKRAFAAGKMDLAQAEAVADMIASSSRAAHRIAMNQMRGKFSVRLAQLREMLLELASLMELELDFSEEDVEFASREKLRTIAHDIDREVSRLYNSFSTGAAIRDGIPVAIVGATNAGKSSLLNAILGDDRAIVSDIHGTTRDIVEDTIEIGDYLFRFMDTAGLRHTDDKIEAIGIDRSIRAAERARIIILVIDASDANIDDIRRMTPWSQLDADTSIIIALNKTDLARTFTDRDLSDLKQYIASEITSDGTAHANIRSVEISATTGSGIEQLTKAICESVANEADSEDDILVTNARHAQALAAARTSIERVLAGLNDNISGDFIAQDIRETLHHLSLITGDITTGDILQTIFSRFCIGK